MIVDINKTDCRIKCDHCGRFIPIKDLSEGKATELFVPDSDVSYEEHRHHCRTCTEVHLWPKSNQFIKY